MSRSRRKRRNGGGTSVVHQQQHGEGRGTESRPSAVTVTEYREFELREGPIPDAEELIRYGQAHASAPRIILDEFHLVSAFLLGRSHAGHEHQRARERPLAAAHSGVRGA